MTIDNLVHAADSLLCKECVKEDIESERKMCVETIAKHLIKNKNGFQDKKGTIDVLTALLNKNASRRTNKLLSRSQIKTRDKTVGLGSNTGFLQSSLTLIIMVKVSCIMMQMSKLLFKVI